MAMVYKDSHLSDQDLLLAADGELPARRDGEVRRHLESCWTCRKRMAQLEATIGEFVDCYHSLPGRAPFENGSDALMRLRLVEESSQAAHRGILMRFGQWFLFRLPALATVALLAALVVTAFLSQQRRQRLAIQNAVSDIETGAVPNPRLTPGESTSASSRDVCQVPAQAGQRDVPEALRAAVFSAYGMKNARQDAYEVDYLITPELGGSTSLRNLWPEPYNARTWNAAVKDVLELRLHALVCHGDIDLATAQREIATNWVDAYKKYVGPDHPM